MTDDGSFRVIVARTTDTTRQILHLQNVSGPPAETFADLLTATVLFREVMSPNLRVQGILKSNKSSSTLVADSAPEGKTRGLAQGASNSVIATEDGALLQMMRTLHNGSVNQGLVRVPPQSGITEAMMAYMQESEQVDTMLSVGAVFDREGRLTAAGGYMVQLLPELGKAPLAIMTERLEDFRTIHHLLTPEFTPESLRDELLYRMPFTHLDASPISAQCWCSHQRLLGALATLGRDEIQDMISEGEPLQINCDYCGKEYTIPPGQLAGLVDEN